MPFNWQVTNTGDLLDSLPSSWVKVTLNISHTFTKIKMLISLCKPLRTQLLPAACGRLPLYPICASGNPDYYQCCFANHERFHTTHAHSSPGALCFILPRGEVMPQRNDSIKVPPRNGGGVAAGAKSPRAKVKPRVAFLCSLPVLKQSLAVGS